MMTEPTRPMATLRLGFLLSSARGPVDSHPLKAKIENTRPTTTHTHHQIVTPYSLLIDGSSTVFARSDRVSAPTGGSQTENSMSAKKPARGWKARAIQVHQPPADGNAFASYAADSVCS